MIIKCKNCLPKQGIEIPEFTKLEKQELLILKQESSIIEVIKKLCEGNRFSSQEAKFIAQHMNIEYGKCNRCNFNKLDHDYINCPQCKTLNINWKIN